MKSGQFAETTRSFTAQDLADYAALTGAPPEQMPADAVPEPLIGALFSGLLGMHLPGLGSNILKLEMRFLAPAPLDQPLSARARITRLRPDKHLLDLAISCRLADGRLICEGHALVLARDIGT